MWNNTSFIKLKGYFAYTILLTLNKLLKELKPMSQSYLPDITPSIIISRGDVINHGS